MSVGSVSSNFQILFLIPTEGIILENIGGFCMFTSTMLPMNAGDRNYILSQSYVEWGQPVLKQWVGTKDIF